MIFRKIISYVHTIRKITAKGLKIAPDSKIILTLLLFAEKEIFLHK